MPLFNRRLLGTCFRFLKEAVGPLYKGEQHKTKTHNFSAYSPKNPPKVRTFSPIFNPFQSLKMVMTRSDGTERRRLIKEVLIPKTKPLIRNGR